MSATWHQCSASSPIDRVGVHPPRQSFTASLPPAARQHDVDDPLELSATLADVDGTIITTVSRHTERPFAADDDGAVTVVAVVGDVDQDTVPLLTMALTSAIDASERVCCDLSRVDFFSAAGVNMVLAAHRHATTVGHRFSVRGARGITRRVFEITEMHRILTFRG